jgi:hypothetical protein
MNKSDYWTGHVLSGSDNLFSAFQRDTGAAPAQPAAGAAGIAAASPAAASAGPTAQQLRAAAIWHCALTVTKVHYDIDSNDPAGSLAQPTDWSNAAGQQAAVMALNINAEAPAIAAHDEPDYNLQWTAIVASDLTGCASVGAVLSLVRSHYA